MYSSLSHDSYCTICAKTSKKYHGFTLKEESGIIFHVLTWANKGGVWSSPSVKIDR